MWAFLALVFLLVFACSLIGLLFKGTRSKAKWAAPVSAIAMIVAIAIFGGEQDDGARRVGFLDAADQRAAADAGVTDPAAWRAAKEAKRQAEQAPVAQAPASNAEPPKASSEQAVASVNQGADTNQKTYAGRVLSGVGRAKICATKDMTFDDYREIMLPVKSVFKDSGSFKGDVHVSDQRWAAFITTDPVTLTKAKPCAESDVRMF